MKVRKRMKRTAIPSVWLWGVLVTCLDHCDQYKSCVECTSTTSLSLPCKWKGDERTGRCSIRGNITDETDTYYFDDTCPVDREPSSWFLSNWMSELYPVIKHLTLLDLSFPGITSSLARDII